MHSVKGQPLKMKGSREPLYVVINGVCETRRLSCTLTTRSALPLLSVKYSGRVSKEQYVQIFFNFLPEKAIRH